MTGTRFPAPGHSVIGDRRWWRISGQSRLDAMLNCVPNKECAGDGVPWQPGNSMQIRSRGGARSLERERMAIVGHAGYVNIVTGHRETTTDTQALVCEQSRVIDVGRMDSSASDDGAGVEWGRDRLHVKGDAVLEYGSRGANVTGTVERIWNQHSSCTAGLSCVTRAAGVVTHAIHGPAIDVSAFNTVEVRGGTARTAGCRIHLAAFSYQVVTKCTRAYGLYYRNAAFTITPHYLRQEDKYGGQSSIRSKLRRLGSGAWYVYRRALPFLPPVPVLGLIPLVGIAFYKAYWLIRNARREYAPVARPIRVHRLYCDSINAAHTQMIHL